MSSCFGEEPVHTPSEMEEYRRLSPPPPPGLKPLVVYGPQEALEGDPPDAVVILEFPSTKDARDWYNGPYGEAAKHRQAAAKYRGVIVEGWDGTVPG